MIADFLPIESRTMDPLQREHKIPRYLSQHPQAGCYADDKKGQYTVAHSPIKFFYMSTNFNIFSNLVQANYCTLY